jgi:dimeric dUTPase (all-alpha-NTP-PPase superfamily)
MNIDLILQNQRVHIDDNYEEFASVFCNIAGFEKSKTKDRFVLSNWMEGYLYSCLIGIQSNSREIRKGKKLEKTKWSYNYVEQYKYVISILLSKKDVLNELNILSRETISNNFISIENTLEGVKTICDEYSNGGLKYLYDLYQKDDTIFNEYDSLTKIYKELS